MGRRPKTDKEKADMREIGRRIAAARDKKGWTQEKLGEEVGRALTTVSTWERGESMPSPTLLAKIAEKTGESVSFFSAEKLAPKDSIDRLSRKVGMALGQRRLEALAEMPERALRREIDAMLGAYADARGRLKVSSE